MILVVEGNRNKRIKVDPNPSYSGTLMITLQQLTLPRTDKISLWCSTSQVHCIRNSLIKAAWIPYA